MTKNISNDDLNQPWAEWEEVDVTFSSTANRDTVVTHHMSPPSPEHVHYVVLRKGQAADVYHDTSGTRKPWGSGYVILRSTVANAKVTLLLTVPHFKRTLAF